jgi:hypothetical protein
MATDQWAQRVASRPNSLVGRPHFVASHRLASRACSPRGGNKESEAGTRWRPDSVAARRITDLIKSVTPAWTPINTPCLWNSRYHTLLVLLHL